MKYSDASATFQDATQTLFSSRDGGPWRTRQMLQPRLLIKRPTLKIEADKSPSRAVLVHFDIKRGEGEGLSPRFWW